MKKKLKIYLKEEILKIERAYKVLHSDGDEMDYGVFQFDEGYWNGRLNEIKRVLKFINSIK